MLAATSSLATGNCNSPRSRLSIKRSRYSSGFMPALLSLCAVIHAPAPDVSPAYSVREIVKHALLRAVYPVPGQGPRFSALLKSDQSRSTVVPRSDYPEPTPLLQASRAIRATQLDYSPGRLPTTPHWNDRLSCRYPEVGYFFSRYASSAVGLWRFCPGQSEGARHKNQPPAPCEAHQWIPPSPGKLRKRRLLRGRTGLTAPAHSDK